MYSIELLTKKYYNICIVWGDFMDYSINLPEFEGPLDLLLHLIKKNDIDIFNISIDDITKQYLEYINKMEELNLNIASEYLVMASDLIEIKSRTLLPKEENEEDPKEELINKLINYQNYKETTEVLKKYEEIRHEVYTREPTIEEYSEEVTDLDLGIDLNDLVNALSKFIQNKEAAKPLTTKVTNKEYSVGKRCTEIRDILRTKKKVDFFDLFEIVNKEYVVVTFLAILNMSKRNELIIKQEDNFNKITVLDKGSE